MAAEGTISHLGAGRRAGGLCGRLGPSGFQAAESALSPCSQITTDRKSVESRTDHALEVGGRRLKILVQRGEGDVSRSQLTEQASPSYSVPSRSSVPQLEEQAAKGRGDTTREAITKKVHQEKR